MRHHPDAEGLPIVLVHGSPDHSKSFAAAVVLLSDHPVIVYDRRGYGKSLAAGADGGGFSTHADDLIDLLDGTPHVVVGQSAGGAIAMLASTRAPELFLALGVWEPPMVSQRQPFFDVADLTVRMVVGAGAASLSAAYAGAHERTAEQCKAEYLSIAGVNHFAHTGNPLRGSSWPTHRCDCREPGTRTVTMSSAPSYRSISTPTRYNAPNRQ